LKSEQTLQRNVYTKVEYRKAFGLWKFARVALGARPVKAEPQRSTSRMRGAKGIAKTTIGEVAREDSARILGHLAVPEQRVGHAIDPAASVDILERRAIACCCSTKAED